MFLTNQNIISNTNQIYNFNSTLNNRKESDKTDVNNFTRNYQSNFLSQKQNKSSVINSISHEQIMNSLKKYFDDDRNQLNASNMDDLSDSNDKEIKDINYYRENNLINTTIRDRVEEFRENNKKNKINSDKVIFPHNKEYENKKFTYVPERIDEENMSDEMSSNMKKSRGYYSSRYGSRNNTYHNILSNHNSINKKHENKSKFGSRSKFSKKLRRDSRSRYSSSSNQSNSERIENKDNYSNSYYSKSTLNNNIYNKYMKKHYKSSFNEHSNNDDSILSANNNSGYYSQPDSKSSSQNHLFIANEDLSNSYTNSYMPSFYTSPSSNLNSRTESNAKNKVAIDLKSDNVINKTSSFHRTKTISKSYRSKSINTNTLSKFSIMKTKSKYY